MSFTLATLTSNLGPVPAVEIAGAYYRIEDVLPGLIRRPKRLCSKLSIGAAINPPVLCLRPKIVIFSRQFSTHPKSYALASITMIIFEKT